MTCKGITGEIIEEHTTARQFCFEWKIPRFLFLSDKAYDYYESPRFSFEGASWYMRIFPNWSSSGWLDLSLCTQDTVIFTDSNRGEVSFGSSLEKVPFTKTVTITIGIKGVAGLEKKTEAKHEFRNCANWPVWNCCSRAELSQRHFRLMWDDALIIAFQLSSSGFAGEELINQSVREEEAEISTEESKALEKEAMEEFQNSLRSLLKNEVDCDVIIKVQGKVFRAHRSILQARSPVFQAMFAHDMLERQKNIVTLEDCDPEIFPDFLEHIYTGSVRMISPSNALGIYVASDKYDLKTLKKECVRSMKRNMTVASFCDIVALAAQHNEEELIQHAAEFFCTNSLEIVKTVEWQLFLKENTTVGNELFIKLLSK